MRGKLEKTSCPNIYKIGPNKWQVRISRGPRSGIEEPGGAGKKKTKYGVKSRVFEGSFADAKIFQSKLAEKYQKNSVSITGMTMQQLVTRYFEHVSLSHSTSTVKHDKGRWNVLKKALGDRKVQAVTAFEVDGIFDDLMLIRGVKPQTVNRYHATLSAIFEKAVKWGVVDSNPLDKVEKRTPKHVPRTAIDPETVAGVMASMRNHDPLLSRFVELAYLLGCRRSEVCGLQVGDWDEARQEITIQRGVKMKEGGGYAVGDCKAHNIRTFKPPPDAIAIIKEQKASLRTKRDGIRTMLPVEAFLFSPNGGTDAYIPDTLSQRFDRLKERMCPNCYEVAGWRKTECPACHCALGVELLLKNLRRFNTTTRLRAKVNPAYVQYTGGWKDQKVMLDHYSDFYDDDSEASHEALSAVLRKPSTA